MLRQVSPESNMIFDFIMELYHSCNGEWERLQDNIGISKSEMRSFLDFAAVFLHNIGNYYGKGDQKFIPDVTDAALEKLSKASPSAAQLLSRMANSLSSEQPVRLGFTDLSSQTRYYIGSPMTAQEVERVSDAVLKQSVQLENTRISKQNDGNYNVLVASTNQRTMSDPIRLDSRCTVSFTLGDHSTELQKVCNSLAQATQYASSSIQQDYIIKVRATFETGDMEFYRDSQRLWVQDRQPSVETIFGFVEPYRDPYGVRTEFEGLAAVVHKKETELLSKLVRNADRFIATLPWVRPADGENDKGPFEVDKMGFRDFTSVHRTFRVPLVYQSFCNQANACYSRSVVQYRNLGWAESPECMRPPKLLRITVIRFTDFVLVQ